MSTVYDNIFIHIYTIHLPVTTPLYSQYIPASHPHYSPITSRTVAFLRIWCCPLSRGQLHLPAEAGGQHLGFAASEDRARALAAAWSDGSGCGVRPKAFFFWNLFRHGEVWRFQLFHFGGPTGFTVVVKPVSETVSADIPSE